MWFNFQYLLYLSEGHVLDRTNEQYKNEYCNILDNWILKNKTGYGINWTISMEVSIRAINLCLSLIVFWKDLGEDEKNRYLILLYDHLQYLKLFPEISDVPVSIIELNSHCLIIDGTPRSSSTLAWSLSLSHVVRKKLHLNHVFFLKLELMGSTHNLNVIWSFVGANLICLKQIDRLNVGGDMELPLSVSIISKAMNWLISPHEISWRQVINQAGHS